MKTCQNPKCKAKYKSNNKRFCSMLCFHKCQRKREGRVTNRIKLTKQWNEKLMWKEYWKYKQLGVEYSKLTKKEFEIKEMEMGFIPNRWEIGYFYTKEVSTKLFTNLRS